MSSIKFSAYLALEEQMLKLEEEGYSEFSV